MKKEDLLFKYLLKCSVTHCIAHVNDVFAFVARHATRIRSGIQFLRLRRAVATGRLTDAVTTLERAGHHDPVVQRFIIAMCQMQGGVDNA